MLLLVFWVILVVAMGVCVVCLFVIIYFDDWLLMFIWFGCCEFGGTPVCVFACLYDSVACLFGFIRLVGLRYS